MIIVFVCFCGFVCFNLLFFHFFFSFAYCNCQMVHLIFYLIWFNNNNRQQQQNRCIVQLMVANSFRVNIPLFFSFYQIWYTKTQFALNRINSVNILLKILCVRVSVSVCQFICSFYFILPLYAKYNTSERKYTRGYKSNAENISFV